MISAIELNWGSREFYLGGHRVLYLFPFNLCEPGKKNIPHHYRLIADINEGTLAEENAAEEERDLWQRAWSRIEGRRRSGRSRRWGGCRIRRRRENRAPARTPWQSLARSPGSSHRAAAAWKTLSPPRSQAPPRIGFFVGPMLAQWACLTWKCLVTSCHLSTLVGVVYCLWLAVMN